MLPECNTRTTMDLIVDLIAINMRASYLVYIMISYIILLLQHQDESYSAPCKVSFEHRFRYLLFPTPLLHCLLIRISIVKMAFSPLKSFAMLSNKIFSYKCNQFSFPPCYNYNINCQNDILTSEIICHAVQQNIFIQMPPNFIQNGILTSKIICHAVHTRVAASVVHITTNLKMNLVEL